MDLPTEAPPADALAPLLFPSLLRTGRDAEFLLAELNRRFEQLRNERQQLVQRIAELEGTVQQLVAEKEHLLARLRQ